MAKPAPKFQPGDRVCVIATKAFRECWPHINSTHGVVMDAKKWYPSESCWTQKVWFGNTQVLISEDALTREETALISSLSA